MADTQPLSTDVVATHKDGDRTPASTDVKYSFESRPQPTVHERISMDGLSAETKVDPPDSKHITSSSNINEEDQRKIPPADGGIQAWLFLAGCFMFEALVWGFPFSFGIFQSYYTDHAPFSEHPDGIAAVGTCSTGVMYLFAPISLYFLETFPRIRPICSVVGLVLMLIALLSASFATQVWHLIVTQGVLYAIGGSLMYSPTMFYLDEWFIKRKGFAFGVMWSGVGTSGLIFPFFLSALLDKTGCATTLRIYALILLVLCMPLIYYVKPRVPTPSTASPSELNILPTTKLLHIRFKRPALLHSRTFRLLQTLNILTSLGFFLPAIYLPLYATETLSLSSTHSVLLLAILNLFSVLGAISMGYLCDRLHVRTVVLISTVGSVGSAFLLWGLAGTLGVLVAFAAGWGFFAGGFSAIWTGMIKHLQHEFSPSSSTSSSDDSSSPKSKDSVPKMGTLMGLFSAGRGIGAVCSGPISEALLSRMHGRGIGAARLKNGSGEGYGYASQYGVLIVFTGVTAVTGLLALGLRGCAPMKEGEKIETIGEK